MDTDTFIKSLGSQLTIEGQEVPHENVVAGKSVPIESLLDADDLAVMAMEDKDDPIILSNLTPSGILVEYSPSPRRFYRVNGTEVPSVTTVLGVLKKDLGWWGQTTGVEGVLELFNRKRLTTSIDWLKLEDGFGSENIISFEEGTKLTAADITALLTAERLTVNHTKDKAADRGTTAHSALESWAGSGGEYFPTPQDFPEELQPYVNGVLDWIQTMGGAGKPVLSEVMVGSAVHGFAGRFDLCLQLSEATEFVVRALRKPKTVVVAAGRYTVDMKTKNKRPKEPYTTDMKQLAGYEIAAVECGYPPTDGQLVLYVMADGTYEFVPSYAKADDFLSALQVHKTDAAMKERK